MALVSVRCQRYSSRCPLLLPPPSLGNNSEVREGGGGSRCEKTPPKKSECCPLWVSALWQNFTGILLRNSPHPTHHHHHHQHPTFDFICESFNSSPLPLLSPLYFFPWQPPGFFSEKKAVVLGLRFNWNNICCTPLPPRLYSPLTTGIIFSLCAEFCHFLLQGSLCFWPQAGSNTLCSASTVTPFLTHPSTAGLFWTTRVFTWHPPETNPDTWAVTQGCISCRTDT